MGRVRNILFVMADQLRADYLSCYGHRRLKTPAIDALAHRGVRFSRANVNATVCGPSRMSYYTGRSMTSHGSTWNTVPLRVGEPTLGDHLRALGLRTVVVGKTHMAADRAGMARLGIAPDSVEGVFASECGFEPYERDDGLHPDGTVDPVLAYNLFLRERGYAGANPWHSAANAGESASGETLSGWYMRNAPVPARVAEPHSETAYMTDRAMDFIREAGDAPWCLHLSYIKPHWPYIAPAPYHAMYGPEDVFPVNRSERERTDPHPVYAAYMRHPESKNFAREEIRATVIPVYMGLVRQIDDHLTRLFAFMEECGLLDNTMIVICSDHGDYLGDHWLGEKELFHEESVHVPLIIYDPDPAGDAMRGRTDDRLVEAIDLVPTFIEACGGTPPDHILEGRSLLPSLRGERGRMWRDAVVSELDYSYRPARAELDVAPDRARAWMLRGERWKYIYYEGFRPQVFDLVNDPCELDDRGDDPALSSVCREHADRLFEWLRARRTRITVANNHILTRRRPAGLIIGEW
ncbi:MAG TPA: alkaline phosphatase family protein [Rhizomicrobium sp.]|jgi:arylsulfatase A-like enzyme|nr:alkaline phosphatase family protein [Rhizomicrobium sp.]